MKEFHKVSRVFENQLPEYIREQYPQFIQFMEAYYEWLDQPAGAFGANKRLTSYNDIDNTLDEFVSYFKKEFMVSFPETHLADKRLLLKHIKDFYRAKGSEKSYRLLFNVLFQSDVDFYYPHVDLLRPSNGKWQENKVIRSIKETGDPFDLSSKIIFGVSSGASAFVNNVKKIQLGPYVVYELELNLSSIQGRFEPNETLRTDDSQITVGAHSLFNGIIFSGGGENYSVGDKIIIRSEYKGGYYGRGYVTSVSEPSGASIGGAIQSIQVVDFGIGYFNVPEGITTTNQGNTYNPSLGDIEIISDYGIGATGEFISLPFTEYPGFFANDDGKLSWTDKIQDGFFYQQYSYVVFVNESIDKYRSIVKKLIHPAGLQFFGGFRTIQEMDASLQTIEGLSHKSTILTITHKTSDIINTPQEPYMWFDLSGTITTVDGINLVGIGTEFERQLQPDSVIKYGDSIVVVQSIVDNENLILKSQIIPFPFNSVVSYRIKNLSYNISCSQAMDVAKKRDTPNNIYFVRENKEPEFIQKIQVVESETSFGLGYSVRDLDRDKFYHKPTELLPGAPDLYPQDALIHGQTTEVIAPNNNYWQQYGNIQLNHYEYDRINIYEWGGQCLAGSLTFTGTSTPDGYDVFGKGTSFTEELFPGELDKYRGSIIQYKNFVAIVQKVISNEHIIIDREFPVLFKNKAVRIVFRKNEKIKTRLKLQPEPTILIKSL